MRPLTPKLSKLFLLFFCNSRSVAEFYPFFKGWTNALVHDATEPLYIRLAERFVTISILSPLPDACPLFLVLDVEVYSRC